jgi:methionine biosynthesis protein MetW
MSVLRPDLEIISHWIRPATRVLDLGCGDGTLLRHLQETREVTGYGLEIDPDNVVRSLQAGIQVIQMDVDQGLTPFADQSFDYVILTQALQVVRYPEQLLREMLRVGREGIVTFPNFGHWRCRLQVAWKGRMPVSETLPEAWYNTPNIHLCTVRDFETLCRDEGYRTLSRQVVDSRHHGSWFMHFAPNLLGEIALYSLTGMKGAPPR